MDPTTTEQKQAINVANSWKMYSVRFVSLFSLAATAAIGWFLGLPADCAPLLAATPPTPCTLSQFSVLARFGIAAVAVPPIAAALTWYLRIRPQANLTPAVAEAKSDTTNAPPAPPAAGA